MIQAEGIFTGGGAAPNLQSKSVTYTENGSATVTPDAGYDGLSSVDVTVNVSGGGGVENESCTIGLQGCFSYDGFIAYTEFRGGRIRPVVNYLPGGFEIYPFPPLTILKNSSFFIGGITGDYVAEGSIVDGTTNQDGYYSFWVTGDCQITF